MVHLYYLHIYIIHQHVYVCLTIGYDLHGDDPDLIFSCSCEQATSCRCYAALESRSRGALAEHLE